MLYHASLLSPAANAQQSMAWPPECHMFQFSAGPGSLIEEHKRTLDAEGTKLRVIAFLRLLKYIQYLFKV
jgi:hypothetical protein